MQQQPGRLFKDTVFLPAPFSSKSSRKINYYSSSFIMCNFLILYSLTTPPVTELLRPQCKLYSNWTDCIYGRNPHFAYFLQNKLRSQRVQSSKMWNASRRYPKDTVTGPTIKKYSFIVCKRQALWNYDIHSLKSACFVNAVHLLFLQNIVGNYFRCSFDIFSKYTQTRIQREQL